MFFVLSKTLNYLVMPLTMVVVLLLLSFFIRHPAWRTWTRTGALVLLLLFSNEFIANEFMKRWEIPSPAFAEMRKYKLGIVLTGTVIPQLTPDDRVYFSKGADRVVHTVQLYKLGIIDRILVSGGSGRLIDIQEREADQLSEAMVLMGVPDSVILLENETRNTYESAREVARIVRQLGYSAEDCLLITSAFHMRRSLACYEKQGLPLDAFTADFYAHHHGYSPEAFFVPKLEALIIWHKLVKEWVGFIAYRMAGYI